MAGIRSWPPVLLRRWLLQTASGLGCLAAGLLMFFTSQDAILLVISIAVFLCFCIQCAAFYAIVSKGKYEAIEGVCIELKSIPFQKQRIICLRQDTGRELSVSLDRQTKAEIGGRYRAYFRLQSFPEQLLALEPLLQDYPDEEK